MCTRNLSVFSIRVSTLRFVTSNAVLGSVSTAELCARAYVKHFHNNLFHDCLNNTILKQISPYSLSYQCTFLIRSVWLYSDNALGGIRSRPLGLRVSGSQCVMYVEESEMFSCITSLDLWCNIKYVNIKIQSEFEGSVCWYDWVLLYFSLLGLLVALASRWYTLKIKMRRKMW
jgi:hypothetical protein